MSVGRSKIISNTLIRASAATIAYSHGLINNVEEFANEFMKNRKDTSQKHYIMKHWSSNVSRKYSMGLYNIFGYCNANDVEKVKVFSSNASEIKKQIDPKEMLNYVQDVLQKISLEVNETVTDEKLVAFFSSDNVQKSVSPPKQSSQSTCSKLHKLPEPMEVQEVEEVEEEITSCDLFKEFVGSKKDDFYVMRKQYAWFDRRHCVLHMCCETLSQNHLR